ncbi:MAG: hypothetical protein ACW99A_13245 [Candidatus Kariarchaeaceae archaeon]|jgi:hypothetical protein
MTDLRISLRIFKNRLKIRYPLITIGFIVLSLIIPVFLPYNQDYSPINSFSNNDKMGHSQLLDHLESNFNIYQEHLDITKYGNPSSSVITIISPQRFFTDSEINFLDKWADQGGHLIIGGTSKHVIDLLNNLNVEIAVSESKLLDFSSPYENPNYVPIKFESDRQTTFTAVSPLSVDYNSPSKIDISTSLNAEKASCVEFEGTGCMKTHEIGFIDFNQKFAVFLDNWLLRNFIMDDSAQNLMFIENIINNFNSNIENIILDESHYNWAPINRKGVEVLVKNLSQSQFYPPIIFLFSVVLPLLLVIMNGNFTKSKETDTSPITSKLRDRIDRLYLDKIIAVPLSMEEQVLVEENLELNARNQYYFQYVASYYLDVIEEKELTEEIPSTLMDSLNFMKHEVFDKQASWELIKIINHYLDESIKGKKERS